MFFDHKYMWNPSNIRVKLRLVILIIINFLVFIFNSPAISFLRRINLFLMYFLAMENKDVVTMETLAAVRFYTIVYFLIIMSSMMFPSITRRRKFPSAVHACIRLLTSVRPFMNLEVRLGFECFTTYLLYYI